MHRRGRDEQHARSDDEASEGAMTVGVRVAESMGLVDNKEAGRVCRGTAMPCPYGSVPYTERFVRHDRRIDGEALQKRAPLGHEHRRHDQRERLRSCQRDGEGDVRLPESYGVGEERTAVAPDNRVQSLGGGDLVRREPRGPRLRVLRCLERRPVEQRARRTARDRARRRLARRPRPERDGERLRDRDETLSKNPVHGGRGCRARTHPQRRRRSTRDGRRG